MGYPMIFEDKVVKLGDGRILFFDRSGCNNDDRGRKNGIFDGRIYDNEHDFLEYANRFKIDSKPYKDGGKFDLKIHSRYASYYDYGQHLIRMYKRAENFKDFVKNNYFDCKYVKSKEQRDGATYYHFGFLYEESVDRIAEMLKKDEPLQFHIGKREVILVN